MSWISDRLAEKTSAVGVGMIGNAAINILAAPQAWQSQATAILAGVLMILYPSTAPVTAAPAATLAPPPTIGAVAGALLLAVMLATSACTIPIPGQLTPTEQAAVTVACNVDALAQPVAVAIANAVDAQAVASAESVDAQLVHPVVTAACAAINGKPASVTVTTAAP